MEVIASNLGLLEGPVICRDGSLLVTSIDRGLLYRIEGGMSKIFADVGGGPNGATEGPDQEIFVAQNGGIPPGPHSKPVAPGVQVVGRDGAVRWLTDKPRSPNDLAFGPDGRLYITDPTRKPERDDGRIWACDITTGDCELLIACDWYPNGIGFSSDDRWIYVADSRHRRVVRIPFQKPSLAEMEVVFTLPRGGPDGFAFDVEDNMLIGCPVRDGLPGNFQVWSSSGVLLEQIEVGSSRYYTNIALAGDGTYYLCDASEGKVLTGLWPKAGLVLHPFRRKW